MTDAEALGAGPLAYFPHDANAADDLKVRKLLRAYGFEGYGRWWRLCELLAGQRGHAVPAWDDEDVDVLCDVLGFGGAAFDELLRREECRRFIDDLARFGLLRRNDEGAVYSERMMANAKATGTKRAAGRKGGRPRRDADAPEAEEG